MNFEQLDEHLERALSDQQVPPFNDLQKKVISRIKQGGDAVFVAPGGSGRTTAVAFGSIVKAPGSYEGSPRVIIYSSTVDKAHQLHAQLKNYVRRTEISIELAHDKGNMVQERNNIFDGADILVVNPKKMLDLYIQNGVHINQLTLIIIDDADEIAQNNLTVQHINRLTESFPRSQRFMFTKELNPKVEKLMEIFCKNPAILGIDE
jgi:superfamily II DNA/RNA helicase